MLLIKQTINQLPEYYLRYSFFPGDEYVGKSFGKFQALAGADFRLFFPTLNITISL